MATATPRQAQGRGDAQDRKEVGADGGDDQPFRRAYACEIARAIIPARDLSEAGAVDLPGGQLRIADKMTSAKFAGHHEQLAGIAIRQRLDEGVIKDGKDGSVRADAERE